MDEAIERTNGKRREFWLTGRQEWLTAAELATLSGISKQAISKRIAAGIRGCALIQASAPKVATAKEPKGPEWWNQPRETIQVKDDKLGRARWIADMAKTTCTCNRCTYLRANNLGQDGYLTPEPQWWSIKELSELSATAWPGPAPGSFMRGASEQTVWNRLNAHQLNSFLDLIRPEGAPVRQVENGDHRPEVRVVRVVATSDDDSEDE